MLYQVALASAIQQRELAISVYIYPLPLEPPSHLPMPPLWIVTEHWAELPVLYGSFPLAIYFTYGNAHVSVLLSVHPTFSFPRCNHVSSLCLCLYSCPANRFRHKKE